MAALLCVLAAALGVAAPARAASPPVIGAPAAVLVEPATGDVVYQRNADQRRAIASTTKIMTALVAYDRLALDDVLAQVRYAAGPGESLVGLRAGERMTVRDFLRGLLLESGNDAAQTLAVRSAGSRAAFVALMNARARRIGLRNTHFTTPVGLDSPGNYSTAADLAKLALILRTKGFLRATTDMPRAVLHVRGGRDITVVNRNSLVLGVPWVNGVKTGHTSRAGYVLVGSATRHGVTVISAVLGTPSETARDHDSLALLRYGLARYHVVAAVRAQQRMASARIRYQGGRRVALVASRTVRRTARRGERLFTELVGVPDQVEGPLPRGTRVGTILVRQRGRTVDRVALVTADAVAEATAFQRLKDFGGRPGTIVLFITFVGGSLLLVLLRRRTVRRRRTNAEAEIA